MICQSCEYRTPLLTPTPTPRNTTKNCISFIVVYRFLEILSLAKDLDTKNTKRFEKLVDTVMPSLQCFPLFKCSVHVRRYPTFGNVTNEVLILMAITADLCK